MTKLEILMGVLSDREWHSTMEWVETVGHRFSATIHVAVHQHCYQIERRRSGDRWFEYRLMS
jgi:hypothetical protein